LLCLTLSKIWSQQTTMRQLGICAQQATCKQVRSIEPDKFHSVYDDAKTATRAFLAPLVFIPLSNKGGGGGGVDLRFGLWVGDGALANVTATGSTGRNPSLSATLMADAVVVVPNKAVVVTGEGVPTRFSQSLLGCLVIKTAAWRPWQVGQCLSQPLTMDWQFAQGQQTVGTTRDDSLRDETTPPIVFIDYCGFEKVYSITLNIKRRLLYIPSFQIEKNCKVQSSKRRRFRANGPCSVKTIVDGRFVVLFLLCSRPPRYVSLYTRVLQTSQNSFM
jgi:hypothetical protein